MNKESALEVRAMASQGFTVESIADKLNFDPSDVETKILSFNMRPVHDKVRKENVYLSQAAKRELVKMIAENPQMNYTKIGKLFRISRQTVNRIANEAGIRKRKPRRKTAKEPASVAAETSPDIKYSVKYNNTFSEDCQEGGTEKFKMLSELLSDCLDGMTKMPQDIEAVRLSMTYKGVVYTVSTNAERSVGNEDVHG